MDSKEAAKIKKRLENLVNEGFFNCIKVKLDHDVSKSTVKVGQRIGGIVKAIHEENINEFNDQQINTGEMLLKIGYDYEVFEKYASGRVYPRNTQKEGQPMPYALLVEKKEQPKNANEENVKAVLKELGVEEEKPAKAKKPAEGKENL